MQTYPGTGFLGTKIKTYPGTGFLGTKSGEASKIRSLFSGAHFVCINTTTDDGFNT